jgi:hypothetical protein
MVAELDVIGITILETKADSPLIIDADRVLARPVPLQGIKTIARRNTQVTEADGGMD